MKKLEDLTWAELEGHLAKGNYDYIDKLLANTKEEAEAKGYAKAKNDHVIKCANLIRSEYARGRAELMKEMYGEKCKDYDEDCIVCSQYEVYEELQAQEK